jgi:NADH dehydrogenase [ubiquinone] 1 alpha subcomplex assembly factor 7
MTLVDTQAIRAPMRAILVDQIRAMGPLGVPAFMNTALMHHRHGYYVTRDPLGSDGDFITAPEISQIFGELIGLFFAQSWLDMGAPGRLELAELGPGRGVMAGDMLRAAGAVPGFVEALSICLVEASPALQAVQADTLQSSPVDVCWKSLHALEKGTSPLFVVANEFFDCLPSRQFIRAGSNWHERLIDYDAAADRFVSVMARMPAPARDMQGLPPALSDAPDGSIYEEPIGQISALETILDAVTMRGGRALIIDYGPDTDELGDTLQAIHAHQKVDPLDAPGTADITMRVAFAALRRAAISYLEARGVEDSQRCVSPIIKQGQWLEAMGIVSRLQALCAHRPDERPRLLRQVARLTDEGQMGSLFKVMVVSAPGLAPPPGFVP